VVKGLVKYRIADVKTFLLEVYDAQDAISDMTQSIIKNIIMDKSLVECTDSEIDNTLTKKSRVEARKWGVEIQQVTLTDLAPIRSFRLINDTIVNKLD
jgi:regulator of protease activity HflC (stomatin/prohibitin superfamily)